MKKNQAFQKIGHKADLNIEFSVCSEMIRLPSRPHQHLQVGVTAHQSRNQAVRPPTMEPMSECPKVSPSRTPRRAEKRRTGLAPLSNLTAGISSRGCEAITGTRGALPRASMTTWARWRTNQLGPIISEAARKGRHFSANSDLNVSILSLSKGAGVCDQSPSSSLMGCFRATIGEVDPVSAPAEQTIAAADHQ